MLALEERSTRSKASEQRREPTTNSTHIIMALTPRFEPGPHWWKASALNIAPSLSPSCNEIFKRNKIETAKCNAVACLG